MAFSLSSSAASSIGGKSSSTSGGGGGGGSTIQVVIRLRPMNESEKRHGTLPVITAKTTERSVQVIKGKGRKQQKSNYLFDNVFTAFSSQEEVFEATVKPVINDVMRGFESTVFAYGQTGTGKTHTMEGSLSSPELYGVIPRSAQAIFEHLKQPQYKDQVVTCSYLEIYNEELRDLLVDVSSSSSSKSGSSHGGPAGLKYDNQHQKLDIMEGKDGTFCRGLTEKQVHSASDVFNLMQKAQHSRMIGETKMNKSSSRSHCLFTIQVHGKISLLEGDGDMEFTGKLHMVDLAGSECAKSAGNDKSCPDAVARERERMNINRSLLTLGRVITVLKEKSLNKNTNARIPYRDSKLTRCLQEALGGRCKTVLVATISPSITAIEESISTLNYAHSANGIINKPVSSSSIGFGDYNMPSNVDTNSPPTIESWQEMEMRLQYMQTQVDEAQAALARKHLQQQDLQDRAEKAEGFLLETRQQLYDANKDIKSLKQVVETETTRRKNTEKELHETQINLKKTELTLKATQETESSLTVEAQTLISKLEEIVSDRNDLHSLVVSQRDQESSRRKATKEFHEAGLVVLNNIESSFTNLSTSIEASQSSTIKIASLNHEVGRHAVSETQKIISDIAKNVSCVTESIKSQLTGEQGIVPTVDNGTTSVLGAIHLANKELNEGEKISEKYNESMRRRLDDCAKQLDEEASSIKASTGEALQSFESKVVDSKNALSNLVMRLKNSLSNLSEAKAEKASALDVLVGQWRDQSLASSKVALDVTTVGSTSLKNSIDEFQSGMQNHDEMKKSLDDQKTFLDGEGSAHAKLIDKQGTLVNEHRQKLAESNDTQAKLRNAVMQSIMSGMQALVSSEIQKLATTQANHFQVLEKDGTHLANVNEKVTHSAKQIVENVQSTNQLVSDKASIVHSNDLKASQAMASTQSTLEEVMSSSTAHHDLTTDFAMKSLATVSEMKQLDSQNSDVIKMAERDGKACATSLVNSVFKPTSADMKQTLQSSMSTMTIVKNHFVPSVNADIDGLSITRKEIAKKMNDKLESASTQLSAMAGQVTSIANSQHDIAKKLGDKTVTTSNTHTNESMPYYYAELDTGKDKLVSTMTNFAQESAQTISEGKGHGSVVKESMEDFAHNKMQCTKSVDTVPPRKECEFSRNLSSTPAEDEILKEAECDMASTQNDDSASVASVASHRSESPIQPPVDADSSRESQEQDDDDDNASRKSSGSISSLPSPGHQPRLKYRDINNQSDNVPPPCPKPRKPHRLAVNTKAASATMSSSSRRNKGPSGLPTPTHHRLLKRQSPSNRHESQKRRKR